MSTQIPKELEAAIAKDPRIVGAIIYKSGWVPNAYKWPAPGDCLRGKVVDGKWVWEDAKYDRKRPNARGPKWTALSAKGGRLASGG